MEQTPQPRVAVTKCAAIINGLVRHALAMRCKQTSTLGQATFTI